LIHGAVRDAKYKLRPDELALMGCPAKQAGGLFGAPTGIEAVEEIVKETEKDSSAPGRVVIAGILAKDSVPYAPNYDSGSTNPCALKRSTGWARRKPCKKFRPAPGPK